MIALSNLQKSFGKKVVLNGLTCQFDAGKVYGIVGPNGAGKTTLFRCLVGLEEYDGEIVCAENASKAHIGYVPAEPYFLPKITGKEYLTLLLEARHKTVMQEGAYHVFDLPLNQYISSYSTGMKKKLALLGTLLQDNQVYIFDEVYNGLDFQSCLMVTDIIKRLRSQGKLIILASHIFSLLEETCDTILYLKDGHFAMNNNQEDFAALKQHIAHDLQDSRVDLLFKKG
ncbi:ABC transporter ATP-binding protein [Sphingobacterium corticibacter]|uniref:ABC transporter ATP-binding protein n=1 Tax=Sphingobacterium corticibacter TaxID=2171749 RepID=A0A2T8HJ31_9SPHI|nr:ATP-binding cassette domain-containing protein [Sphingobacterium corticibacter]PVH25449.1 ABC transporter ATP-binding protein [Sphingobacterium corticibacter]